GISYYDGTNSVLIAELTNSIGQLVSSNQVIFTNAFTDFAADLVMTYHMSGFESDLVFRERPPPPEAFGLSSRNTRLELLTEFFNGTEPQQTSAVTNFATGLTDSTLAFGAMKMVRGKAFQIGTDTAGKNSNKRIPVGKTW